MKPSDPDKACKKCGLPKMYCRCRSLLAALGSGLLISAAFLGVLFVFFPHSSYSTSGDWNPASLRGQLAQQIMLKRFNQQHQQRRMAPPVLFYAVQRLKLNGDNVTDVIVKVKP